ncbi:MAG: AAA family ATPase, partial [bacterium]
MLYGTGENGGFVQLTGEVGTGKTTICRAFLEQVPEEIDIALILNPALNATELLQTICQEFGIELPENPESTKQLVDQLNRYLLDAHARGRRAVLIIDEAQNLKRDVLEQIRLLTNLETTKQKLLQIFLIGQPELKEMLEREDLRQLAQRVTARYHLTPLNAEETAEYIQHRLSVAGAERPLFTASAVKYIYRFSGGVPRLINILCDRALLGAYAGQHRQVDQKITRRAAKELQTPGLKKDASVPVKTKWLAIIASLGVFTALAVLVTNNLQEPPASQPVAVDFTDDSPAIVPVSEPLEILPKTSFTDILDASHNAEALLLELWRPDITYANNQSLCDQARQQGLYCYQSRGTWNNLRQLNRPTLLQVRTADGQSISMLITGLDQSHADVLTETGPETFPISDIDRYWYGDFTLLMQPPAGAGTVIGSKSSAEAQLWLQERLANALAVSDGSPETMTLQQAVRQFQIQTGLTADGVAGPETLIHLNNTIDPPNGPRLK